MCDLSPEQARVLEEAVRFARELTVPPGPPAHAVQAVLAEGAASYRPVRKTTTLQRIMQMTHKRPLTIAAGLVLVAGTLLIWTLIPGGARVAWADVVQRIMEAKTVTCDLVMTDAAGNNTQNWRIMSLEPNRLRMETETPVKLTDLIDLKTGKGLVLAHAQKLAIPIEYGDKLKNKNPAIQDWFGRIRDLLDQPREELGTRQIGNKTTVGYKITKDNQTVILWVDTQTALPVSMESTFIAGSATIKLTNWEFDKPLDPASFEFTPPEGYTLQEPLAMGDASINDAATVLRIWASARGGTFPDDLAPTRFTAEAVSSKGVVSLPEPKGENPSSNSPTQKSIEKVLGRGFLFLATQKEAVYAGKGVKMGDPQTPIYWCKSKDQTPAVYKVIYANCSVRETTEEPQRPIGTTPPR